MTSGTSFSAALVSGIAALLLERNPALKPDDLRAILTKTARDLGAPGRDDLFGAGEADAYAAVTATIAAPLPVAASNRPATEPSAEKPLDQKEVEQRAGPTGRALASDKAVGEADRPAAR
jgi:subtilisin family serine protease